MRLHRLTVTAIGPFPGAERVDFDALAQAGVFLVTGATGAGKSSLLDCVCFALYGVVPGSRGVKGLRSDHAPADVAPEVSLDFSVGGRRFVVRRSPEWTRPKRSGTGVTTVRAAASLLETTGGTERLVSSRAQEVGHTIAELLALTSTQFQQVVLLPQGGFATFLRASSQERHDVLQQLFHTRRFADIEAWLHDHSRALGATATRAADEVRRLAHTLGDRSGEPLPRVVDDQTLATAGSGGLVAWADAVEAGVRQAVAQAAARRVEAGQRLAAAAARHERAQRIGDLRRRRDQARARLAELAASAAEAQRAAAAVADAERAARLAPLLGLLDEAGRTSAACDQALGQVLGQVLRRLPGTVRAGRGDDDLDAATLATLHALRRDVLSRLLALLPREQELHRSEALRDREAAALDRTRTATCALREESDALPAEVQRLSARLESLTVAAARAEGLDLQVEAARRVHEAAAALPQARRRELDARAAAVDARAGAVAAQEALLGLVERRLAGMAAELAGGLVAGDPCPVCGGKEHPRPASADADPVASRDIEAARTRLLARQSAAVTAEQVATEAAAEVHRLAERAAGRDEVEAGRRLDQVAESAREARAAAEERAAVAAELDRARASGQDLRERLERALTAQADAQARHRAAAEAAQRLRTELAEVTGPLGREPPHAGSDADAEAAPCLSDLVAAVQADVGLLEEAVQASRTAEQARAERDRLAVRVEAAARAEQFGSAAAARSAGLAPDERERLEVLLHDRDRQREQAQDVLADPELALLDRAEPGDVEPRDPAETGPLLSAAEQADAEAARLAHLAEETCRAAAVTAASLRAAAAAWEPHRVRAATAETMARLVRGVGADNALQLRLSAYVLATRLDQVVEAANERLAHMREHRYLLERAAPAARRGAPAGLGLQVLDLWTGDTRDPATLSGGETFVVSLALALGLADVVTHEAGGVELQTLFVDEGFGMLDAETLDDVMDRLDGLRTGGRVVGVVSHVSELRGRIPVQLHVHKTRGGSQVAVRTLVT